MVQSVDPFGLIGQMLDGQFRIDALAGEGGFSAVYRGTHVGLEEPIAIKCLKLAGVLGQISGQNVVVDSFVKRFRDEGRLLYRLSQNNLNIVRCIASGTTLSPTTNTLVPYMVLEWMEGWSLGDDLEKRAVVAKGGRTFPEMMSLFEPVFDAMTHAHAMGVIHRDLSTGNIFFAKQRDGSMRAKVLDFGVAKVMTDDLDLGPRTQTLGHIKIFSPAYAAPEQFDSQLAPPGPYSDVYSLALLAVEVLTGKSVRNDATLGEMMQRALDPKAPRTPRQMGAIVTDAVEQVFARALSIEASARQKDAGELWRELKGAQTLAFAAMDLKTTTRQKENPPTTERMTKSPSNPPPPASNFEGLKSTVRMSSPADAPAPEIRRPPNPTPSAGQLFQPAAVPPPPGLPIPQASGSFAGVTPQQEQAMNAAKSVTSSARNDRPPPSSRTSASAQWLVGLLVFILVLAAGGAALRFWLLP